MLRYLTSGESHGKSLISILDGIPANIELNIDEINYELEKRQGGYGRGGRMKIEKDKINILGGVRGKITLGGPISIEIKNKDYENWIQYMNPMDNIDFETKKVEKVRPGHADLVGCLKYDFEDARNVLERSSARETASKVAVGAICKQVLKNFNIEGVEIGIGFDVANNYGSNVMDEIYYNNEDGIKRKTNQLGGIEGGMTTGEELVIRCAMKPIPTLYKPLKSININTLESYSASIERSDNCAVPACSVVCENVVAFVICKYFLDKIGGDNLNDLKSNYNTYIKRLGDRGWKR